MKEAEGKKRFAKMHGKHELRLNDDGIWPDGFPRHLLVCGTTRLDRPAAGPHSER